MKVLAILSSLLIACYCEGQDLRCNGIDGGCCTSDTPCLEGDGDCDHDAHCASGLKCGSNNCLWGDNDDCCYKYNANLRCNGIDGGCCTKDTPCLDGDGDCDVDAHCATGLKCGSHNCPWGDNDDCCYKYNKNLRCNGIDSGCCTKDTPCLEGDGDCDGDSDCGKGLKCGTDNCPWSRHDDCCYRPALRCNGINNGCCTKDTPCGENDGDCDVDAHCATGLKCGTDNCPWGGSDDCCYNADLRCNGIDNGCCTKDTPCGEDDGDCDHDNHCAKGLKCGSNNCGWGGDDDCCYRVNEGLRCNGINNGCCTKDTPCLEDDGDCDSDEDCAEGLKCGTDNCAWGGTDDCCYK